MVTEVWTPHASWLVPRSSIQQAIDVPLVGLSFVYLRARCGYCPSRVGHERHPPAPAKASDFRTVSGRRLHTENEFSNGSVGYLWGCDSCDLGLFFLRELLKKGCAHHYLLGEYNCD